MMSIRGLKNFRSTIKQVGGGRKCFLCSSSGGSVLSCTKCGRSTCVNHLHLTMKECTICSAIHSTKAPLTPTPPPRAEDEEEMDEYDRMAAAYYYGM